MNNEPYGWVKNGEYVLYIEKPDSVFNYIPLYTHPVKEQGNPVAWRSQAPDGYWSVYQSPVEGAEPLYTGFKQLTDEEINKLWAESHEDGIAMQQGFTTQQHYFAHPILRKAHEK